MEWLGARLTQVSFPGEIFFPSKVPEFFKKKSKKKPRCVHCARFDILSPFFLRNKVKTSQKKHGGMFYYESEKHMQKFGHSKERKFARKLSHLR